MFVKHVVRRTYSVCRTTVQVCRPIGGGAGRTGCADRRWQPRGCLFYDGRGGPYRNEKVIWDYVIAVPEPSALAVLLITGLVSPMVVYRNRLKQE